MTWKLTGFWSSLVSDLWVICIQLLFRCHQGHSVHCYCTVVSEWRASFLTFVPPMHAQSHAHIQELWSVYKVTLGQFANPQSNDSCTSWLVGRLLNTAKLFTNVLPNLSKPSPWGGHVPDALVHWLRGLTPGQSDKSEVWHSASNKSSDTDTLFTDLSIIVCPLQIWFSMRQIFGAFCLLLTHVNQWDI